ncbi:MAG: hypothetical protein JWO90_2625, partial [Solirubrobacterales bacterium]|nr:hypothetical protein [Solirubrobacterales bacterium]
MRSGSAPPPGADPDPTGEGAGRVVAERLVALAHALRARGVKVGAGELATAARALAAVDP